MAPRSLILLFAVVGTLVVSPVIAQAQLAVADALLETQSLLDYVQLVLSVNLAIRDLAPLAEISEAIGVAADLQVILTETQSIASQMQSRRAIWGNSGPLPTTTRAFAEMRRTQTALCHLTATQGLQAQSLVAQVPMMLNRLTRLLQSASRILGTVAGLQAANAVMGELTGQVSVLTSAMVSANEPQLCEIWAKRVQEQAMESLAAYLTRDYGQLPGQ